MSTVKQLRTQNENLGMRQYREHYQGIRASHQQKQNHERAKSAYTYSSLISKKEIQEAGGDYNTLLRLRTKIKFGEQAAGPGAPYRNSVVVTSQPPRNERGLKT